MKTNLKITIEKVKMSSGTTYKVDMRDHYGSYSCVYEPTLHKAMQYAIKWHNDSEKRYEENQIHAKAVMEMMAIDRKAGIITGNYDGLD
tara:strand:+ start:245 stop:511 length:267 start_codon:yes stop_codon:yes gene_type:complete